MAVERWGILRNIKIVMESYNILILHSVENFLELNFVCFIREKVPEKFHANRHEWSFPLFR